MSTLGVVYTQSAGNMGHSKPINARVDKRFSHCLLMLTMKNTIPLNI